MTASISVYSTMRMIQHVPRVHLRQLISSDTNLSQSQY